MENLCSTVQSLMSPAQKTKSHWPTAPTDTLGRTPCNHLLEQKDKRKSSRLSTHISHIPKIFVGHCEKARAGEMIAKNATYGVEKRIALGGVNLSERTNIIKKYIVPAWNPTRWPQKVSVLWHMQRSWKCFHAFSSGELHAERLSRSLSGTEACGKYLNFVKLHLCVWICAIIYYWLSIARKLIIPCKLCEIKNKY